LRASDINLECKLHVKYLSILLNVIWITHLVLFTIYCKNQASVVRCLSSCLLCYMYFLNLLERNM
jgi:hypothetical protein